MPRHSDNKRVTKRSHLSLRRSGAPEPIRCYNRRAPSCGVDALRAQESRHRSTGRKAVSVGGLFHERLHPFARIYKGRRIGSLVRTKYDPFHKTGPSTSGKPRGTFPRPSQAVPELTHNRDIKLNSRLSLRDREDAIASRYRILSPSGPSVARLSVVIFRPRLRSPI
jgi:hypothetical protein